MSGALTDDRSLGERWAASWRRPASLTVLHPTADGCPDEQWALLHGREEAISADLAGVEGLHALRLLVVPPQADQGARLLLNSMSDSDYLPHLGQLARVLARHLEGVLPDHLLDPQRLAAALQAHRVRENTIFLASPGISLRQIRQEARLRTVLREWLDAARAEGTLEAMGVDEIRRAVAKHVYSLPDPECACGPAPSLPGVWSRRIDKSATLLFFPLIGVLGKDVVLAVERIRKPMRRRLTRAAMGLWWLYAAPFAGAGMVALRLMELFEREVELPPVPDETLERLEMVEDSRTKNELTEWFPVRKSALGRLMMWAVLFGSERGARHLWTNGQLAGAQNIHFARLVLVDGAKTMIFMSDYEGSFDAYMDHFIGVGGHTRAVVPISSRLWGSPKTRWLYWPRDVVQYRRLWREFARRNQLQAAVRYVAYPSLSANDILNHRAIRDGLFAEELTAEELEAWARRI